jgi:broad specificity phosphatase PhoE
MVAAALKNVPIDVCYASPLSRSYRTAAMCAQYHGLTVAPDSRLLEINHGEWEGLTANEVQSKYPELLAKWRNSVVDVTMPGGENISQVRERAMQALHDYARQHPDKTVLLVAHDAVNKAVLCDILDIDLGHFWQIKQDNTCINVFERAGNTWRLVLMNSTAHLGFLFSGIEQKGL